MVDNSWLFQAWSHYKHFGSLEQDDGHFVVVDVVAVAAVAACHVVCRKKQFLFVWYYTFSVVYQRQPKNNSLNINSY